MGGYMSIFLLIVCVWRPVVCALEGVFGGSGD